MSDSQGSHSELRRHVGRGLTWSLLNTVLGRLGSLVAGIVLARILTPYDYGVYAVAVVVVTALLSFNELGVSVAIVRWREDPGAIAPTVATLALISSAVLYGATAVLSPVVTEVLGAPDATPMLRVLGLCLLFDACASVPAAWLNRGFHQRARLLVDFTGFLTGTVLSVVLAVRGWGAWAMIIGFVVTSLTASGLAIILSPRRLSFGFDREAAHELIRFGFPLAGASFIGFLMLNVDYMVVGSLLGTVELGVYLIAFNLSSWPVNVISSSIRRVALSAFSRLVDQQSEVPVLFARAMASLLFLACLCCVPLAIFATDIITVVYGEKWRVAGGPLTVLAVFAVARIAAEVAGDFLVAADRRRANLQVQGVWLLMLVPALVLGAKLSGIIGVAIAHLAVALLLVPGWIFLLVRAGANAAVLRRAVSMPVLATIPLVAAGLLVNYVTSSAMLRVFVGGPLCLLTYALLCRGEASRMIRLTLRR